MVRPSPVFGKDTVCYLCGCSFVSDTILMLLEVELHCHRVDVLTEEFAKLRWFTSKEQEGKTIKLESTLRFTFTRGRGM